MRTIRANDGTPWVVQVKTPGASNALVFFHHPDGLSAHLDRYAWYLGHGPESKSVTARLDAKKVLDSLSDDDLRRLFARSVRVSRGDTVGAPSNVALAAGTAASVRK